MRSFVALDLELTPFPGDQQRIIEIAAARFLLGAEVDTFSTLVDPCCDLNRRIEALTGICQEEVNAAPCLEEVVPRLLTYIGDAPLVGQSINMDLQCLAEQGVHLGNQVYDTFELATLLLPGLPAYDLGGIARALGVEPEQEHRALSDALVAGRVFLALVDRVEKLGPDVLTQINLLAAHLPDWPLAGLFRESHRLRHPGPLPPLGGGKVGALRQQRGADERGGDALVAQGPKGEALAWRLVPGLRSTTRRPPTTVPPLRPRSEPEAINPEELRSALRTGSAIASALPAFEERGEQLRMMDAVAEALNRSEHLLVEAGTGTGKSLAYLLPAIYYAVRNGRRVVISTNTVNLQDQLYHKDIPALQGCLPLQFRAALLKGRANYLCLRRWLVLSRSSGLSSADALLLIKTLIWLSTTETGDRAELNLTATDSQLWSKISAQADSCALGRCSQFRLGNCFVNRARRNAEGAHLIVVNHALLLSDLASSGGVLPEYSHLIVDEAHHLEEEATEQLGFALSWGDLSSFLAGLHQTGIGRGASGFLPDLLGSVRKTEAPPETVAQISTFISAAQRGAEAAEEEGVAFFEALSCFLHDHVEERPRAGTRLRINSSVRVQPGWSEIEVRWSELSDRLQSLRRQLLRLQAELQRLEDGLLPERDGAVAEITGFESYLDRARTQAEEIVSSPGANGIYWINSGTTLAELALRLAPLHVGEALNNALFSCKDSVTLTSATLTAEGSFDYVRQRLGLEGTRELMVGSPFDYKRSTMLYVVQDIPEPTKPSCQRAVETTIAELVLALEGRTLVLFTSHAQLRLTNSSIRPRLEQQGLLVLAHGLDGSRRRLLQAFKSSRKAVLMGTNSFWEGIDVVGEALSCLVIVKLPFSVPTDPIFAARSEAFEEPFRQYSIPQTILRFKQGFGRLIRSRSDRGAVVILDSRLGNKSYGPAFIHSLPECTVRFGSTAHAAEAAQAWLSR